MQLNSPIKNYHHHGEDDVSFTKVCNNISSF